MRRSLGSTGRDGWRFELGLWVTWDSGHATMAEADHKIGIGRDVKKKKEGVDFVHPSIIQPVMFSFVACTVRESEDSRPAALVKLWLIQARCSGFMTPCLRMFKFASVQILKPRLTRESFRQPSSLVSKVGASSPRTNSPPRAQKQPAFVDTVESEGGAQVCPER